MSTSSLKSSKFHSREQDKVQPMCQMARNAQLLDHCLHFQLNFFKTSSQKPFIPTNNNMFSPNIMQLGMCPSIDFSVVLSNKSCFLSQIICTTTLQILEGRGPKYQSPIYILEFTSPLLCFIDHQNIQGKLTYQTQISLIVQKYLINPSIFNL